MSAKDASDGQEPVEHDGFEEELAVFLSDDWQPACEEDGDSGFDAAAFLAAQQADALRNLEIVVDRHCRTYLVGIAGSDGDQIVLVSVSLAAVED